jgi:parvulin-like peptidyl-prolyl isomerase
VFADEVRDQVDDSGLKQNEYDLMLRAFLAEEKARAYFLFLGPSEEPQVRGRMIILEDTGADAEEEANAVLVRLEAGEDFTVVALEVSLAPDSVDVDWFVVDGEPTVFEDVQDFFFDAEVGERSVVISQRGFFYIIEVQERDTRALDDDQRESVADRQLGDWINELRESLSIEQNFSADDGIRALNELG